MGADLVSATAVMSHSRSISSRVSMLRRPAQGVPCDTTPDRLVAHWLLALAALTLLLIVVGGLTRLTGSGLSITEWRPVTGALPPLSEAAWRAEFAKYQGIPQFQLVNPDLTPDAFRRIYWWEWSHRALARLYGLGLLTLLILVMVRRRWPPRLLTSLVLITVLSALQAALGWWMVRSGLSERVDVLPERLAIHLGAAHLLLGLLVRSSLIAFEPGPPAVRSPWAAPMAVFLGGCSSRSCSAPWSPATRPALSTTTGR